MWETRRIRANSRVLRLLLLCGVLGVVPFAASFGIVSSPPGARRHVHAAAADTAAGRRYAARPLLAAAAASANGAHGATGAPGLPAPNNGGGGARIPFLIERLPLRPNPAVYSEIAEMCITAFFNDSHNSHSSNSNPNNDDAVRPDRGAGPKTPLWKEWQLAYLRRLQAGDLERRRRRDGAANMMFVARRVVPAATTTTTTTTDAKWKRQPLLLDLSAVHNRAALWPSASSNDNSFEAEEEEASDEEVDDCVCGEIVGFVEVTRRSYGLGDDGRVAVPLRPVLTNLSVRHGARGSGVGSRLVAACEAAVVAQWHQQEIVLEVEEDNRPAIDFYQRRGYRHIFTDPSSRRYDTTGLWLQQVRCQRLVLRKDWAPAAAEGAGGNNIGQVLQRIRDNIMSLSESPR